ncbi:MAG TPA: DUF309 domain-containing protein [Thermoanaerobaculia bacterium]|jgi:predicted metal-dependent hydrolase
MDIQHDPRFLRAVEQFNAGDFEEASDGFEELFFEAVRGEVEFVRVFLQVSVGIHHVERGQLRAAVERLEEGVRAIARVDDARGYDLVALAVDVKRIVPLIAKRERARWPQIQRVSDADARRSSALPSDREG